jgi:hypothetical protein
MQQLPSCKGYQPTNRPVLLDAIDITVRAIERRAKLYRNLVVAVSTVLTLSVCFTALIRQWWPFAGVVFLVPLTGSFLFFDSRVVRRWRGGIVEMIKLRGLDRAIFLKTISGFRHLPLGTLKAMVVIIPSGDAESQQVTLQPKRTRAAADFEFHESRNELKLLRSTGLLTIALACLIAGAFYGSIPLLASGVSMIILLLAFGRR